ncbi:uncharacterized protein TNCV_4126551 [Trichonephila clavipes]|nr:uncharacterized protein TNCV_4126551 [Trichonephila clavipes]
MIKAGWSARRVARQWSRFDCIVRRCWDCGFRDMSFYTKTRLRTPSTDQSSRKTATHSKYTHTANCFRGLNQAQILYHRDIENLKGRPTKRRKMLAENSKKRWQKSKTVDEKNSNSMVLQRDTLSEPSTSSQPEASYIFTHKAVFSELLQKVLVNIVQIVPLL